MNWREMDKQRKIDVLRSNISAPNLVRVVNCRRCGIKYDLLAWESCPKCLKLGKKTKNFNAAREQDTGKAQVKDILRARGYLGRQVA